MYFPKLLKYRNLHICRGVFLGLYNCSVVEILFRLAWENIRQIKSLIMWVATIWIVYKVILQPLLGVVEFIFWLVLFIGPGVVMIIILLLAMFTGNLK
jgi:hypothetical protein